MNLNEQAAIVGIGESQVGSVPDTSALQLQRAAALKALEDAGLSFADIDGLLTTPIRVAPWAMPCGIVAQGLGIKPRYLATLDLAGASGTAMVHHAVMAIASGQCETVLCVAGQNMLTHASRGAAVQQLADAGWAHPQFEAPYGPLVPTLYALVAQRHMHDYGTTAEQMAEVAVAMRTHAGLNPAAHKSAPITIDDVLASRMVTSPLHVLDCALVSDGAAAFIVTSRERARDLKARPIAVRGRGYGFSHAYIGDTHDIGTTGAVQAGRDAFAMAGVKPTDIDVAELYDCFTITVIVELEDLGFCPKGEGGRFVEDGRIRVGGELPVTTHGGLLSAGHRSRRRHVPYQRSRASATRRRRAPTSSGCGARPRSRQRRHHRRALHARTGEGLRMAGRPLPYPDALTAPYWAQAKAGVFALPRCEDCRQYHFYPQPACPHCHGDRVAWRPASGRGTIYSYSVVHRAPGAAFADDVPYVVAIIATAEGPHLMSRIVNIPPADVRIGLPVRVRFEKVTDDVALPLFEPAGNGA